MPQQSYFNPQTGRMESTNIDPTTGRPYAESGAFTQGLDPSRLSTYQPQGWNTGTTSYNPPAQTRYASDMGTFTRTEGGPWVGASGQKISDLSGYLQMRGQKKAGADFTGYQNKLSDLLTNPSSIENDPSYQWRLKQGEQAINRSAAARGMLGSGNVLAELAKYGQGMASQEYGNQFNRLSDLMRGAQQFGLQSGYYAEPSRTTSGFEGGALVTRRNDNPTDF